MSPPQHELGLVAGTRTGIVLFNNTLNTFYLWFITQTLTKPPE